MESMASRADALGSRTARRRLWAEFLALYVGIPIGIAVFLPPHRMFLALAAVTLLGLALLWWTGNFRWRELVRGWRQVPWRQAALIAVAVIATGAVLLSLLRPEGLFAFVRSDPTRVLMIFTLYPFLSALPQELVFRALYFHRYGSLIPQGERALILNAAIFSLAHLMYWSVIVSLITFVGGYLFARAYRDHGFPAAWVLHAIGGNALFLVGMGTWFYSGNVVRPF